MWHSLNLYLFINLLLHFCMFSRNHIITDMLLTRKLYFYNRLSRFPELCNAFLYLCENQESKSGFFRWSVIPYISRNVTLKYCNCYIIHIHFSPFGTNLFIMYSIILYTINPLNTKLNSICHLLALFGAHHILHISRIRVNDTA